MTITFNTNECINTEHPPEWVIAALSDWFKSGQTGSFTVHTVGGTPMKIEETAYKKPPPK